MFIWGMIVGGVAGILMGVGSALLWGMFSIDVLDRWRRKLSGEIEEG